MDKYTTTIGVALSFGIVFSVLFWEYLLSLLGMSPDSDELVLGLFHVGNAWQWNAALGIFGIALVYVATTERWNIPEDRGSGELLAALGTPVGFFVAFLMRGHPTNGLLGWKGAVAIFVITTALSCAAFAKGHTRNAAMGLIGLALGISLYVGAAAGACVTFVMALAFFAGLALHAYLLARHLPTIPVCRL